MNFELGFLQWLAIDELFSKTAKPSADVVGVLAAGS
jgi:hypothetical protein